MAERSEFHGSTLPKSSPQVKLRSGDKKRRPVMRTERRIFIGKEEESRKGKCDFNHDKANKT